MAHTHTFIPGKSGAVEVCRCGAFRHLTLKPADIITEVPPPTPCPDCGMVHTSEHECEPIEGFPGPATCAEYERPLLTLPKTLDVVSRALSVIEQSDGADEHAELIAELRAVVGTLQDASMTAGEITLPMIDASQGGN